MARSHTRIHWEFIECQGKSCELGVSRHRPDARTNGRLAYSLLAPLTWTSMTFLPQLPQISTLPGNSYSNCETWFLSDVDSYYTWGQAWTVNSTLLWNGSTVTHHCVMDLTPPLASQFQCDLLRASIHPLYHECLTFGLSIHFSTWNSFGE